MRAALDEGVFCPIEADGVIHLPPQTLQSLAPSSASPNSPVVDGPAKVSGNLRSAESGALKQESISVTR